jgi:putative SOS response-associated peptidase YedK
MREGSVRVGGMCGRFVSATAPEELAAYFGATVAAEALADNFNVAPTADVYAIVDTPEGRQLQVFHWGLVPAWAKEVKIGQKMINARSETISTKPAFKSVFRKYRCIIPADGFYEWQTVPGLLNAKGKPAKQPRYIHRLDGEPLAFAGMWSAWRDPAQPPDAPRLHSATIITTSANGDMAPIHDRMPVLLPASKWAEWLDPTNDDTATLGRLLVPAPDGLLTSHTVSTEVNNVRNRGEQLRDVAPPLGSEDPDAEGRLL